MDDAITMTMAHCFENFVKNVLGEVLCKSSFQLVEHVSQIVDPVIHDQVYIVFILKVVFDLHDIWMIEILHNISFELYGI